MVILNNFRKRKFACFIMPAFIGVFLFTAVTLFVFFAPGGVQAQTVFQSPEEAMEMLVKAAKSNDAEKMLAIFGPEGKDIIDSGDAVADKNNRAKFAKSYKEKVNFVDDNGTVSVILGKDSYPMAVPIVKKEAGWVFNTADGLQELLKRRIGRNELRAISSCQAFVQAQREYAGIDRDMDGVMQYARKFCSEPGRRDGLFWEETEGEPPSPLGPLFVAASKEGYVVGEVCMISPAPYHGYHYKILTAQGANAPGGAYSYLINEHMVAGFALAAWPAEYAVSGIMTFIVNQNGIVYEKDLGPDTDKILGAMVGYNPDSTWSRAQ
ncbi:MAG: DUF2950 domain-containing protein [Candidatus Omnitrophota bacterium]|nr:DUF2950 domain-containing protein [Candidatus Omnitrophota bacterium]